MKTSLAHLPEDKQEELAFIKKIILEYIEETAMIILFGSYARGEGIEDRYVEEGTTYTYISDFDILVVTQNAKAAQYNPKWDRIRDKIDGNPSITRTTLIAHSIHFLNAHLRDNYYFFVEIINQGILLYDSGHYTLEKPKSLSSKKRQQKAQDYFEDWFESANSFLIDFQNAFSRADYKQAAFLLHQATERYYMTFLLVFTDYKPKIHDLKELDAQVSQIKPTMRKVFPKATEKEKYHFELLRKAYIDARYKRKYYSINKEALEYLAGRVKVLRDMTEMLCKEQIESFVKAKQ